MVLWARHVRGQLHTQRLLCALPASRLHRGQPWLTERRQVTCPTSGTLRMDGSKPRAPAWTSAPSRRYFPTSVRRLGHCCCLKRGRAAVLFSAPCQRACATAGVLVRRACPFERAAARVCYEAGAQVATNVALRGLNLGVPVSVRRRLEVVANGLPAFGGIQVAVDVTLVSPLRRGGGSREAEAFLQKLACGRELASPPAQRVGRNTDFGNFDFGNLHRQRDQRVWNDQLQHNDHSRNRPLQTNNGG